MNRTNMRQVNKYRRLTVNQLVVGSIPTAGANQPLSCKAKMAILPGRLFSFICNALGDWPLEHAYTLFAKNSAQLTGLHSGGVFI